MASLVSPGVSVTIEDDSFFIPATAPTVPLFFIATRANKTYKGNECLGTKEYSVVRTITSKTQALQLYGVPHFRTDFSGNSLHGDCRNEYGLLALHQFLEVGNRAYVVRADVDLADQPYSMLQAEVTPLLAEGDGTIDNIVVSQEFAQPQVWSITAIDSVTFLVNGFVSGSTGSAIVGVPFDNGEITFTINSGAVPFVAGDTFEIAVNPVLADDPLGANDAAKRVKVVQSLQAVINSNTDVRSERFEYNIVICPGYFEVVDELLSLSIAVHEEAFVIADTPFTLSPEQTADWASTAERYRSCNVAYYYPHIMTSNYDNQDVFAAASGIALKTFAFSDNIGELWLAPAGTKRGMITGIKDLGYISGEIGTPTTFVPVALNQGQRDILYEYYKNINPIVYFPNRGFVVWGQKTSYAEASSLDRINVVRLVMHIRRNVRKSLQPFLFEPNDQITRDSAKSLIDTELNDIMIRRGLYDYLTVCDDSNNTAIRIDRNELWLDIALKPMKAIEFIYVPIRLHNTGDSF